MPYISQSSCFKQVRSLYAVCLESGNPFGKCEVMSVILKQTFKRISLNQYSVLFLFLLFLKSYTANVYRDLQGLCGGFLQYLQGKPCNIYRLQEDCRENL